jgi:hypothetical protein
MENLTTYLNDHLAGSVAALELTDRLVDTYSTNGMGEFFKELHKEIAIDQKQLQELIDTLGEKESTPRKAMAWMAEKISRVKIQPGQTPKGKLGLLQALEVLFLGIAGKRALWRALATASQRMPKLRKPDYPELEQRAIEQCRRVEEKRLTVAGEALGRA